MDELLSFFSDLIVFTAGILVCIFWIGLVVLIGIEIWDSFHEKHEDEDEVV